MKTIAQSPKRLAMIMTAAFIILAVALGGYFKNHNSSLRNALNSEKIEAEKLLSEKLMLEKEINRLNMDLKSIEGQKSAISVALQSEKAKVSNKKPINTSSASIKKLKSEIEALKQTRNSLNSKLEEANSRIASMETERADMESQIVMLNLTNKEMRDELVLIQSMSADKVQVAAYKGRNDKQTLKAKRTNKLTTSFTVPTYVAANAGFKVVMPDGKVIDKMSKGMSMTYVDDVEEVYASTSAETARENLKEIQLNYAPDERLKPGKYKVELYNGANYITSCIITLK